MKGRKNNLCERITSVLYILSFLVILISMVAFFWKHAIGVIQSISSFLILIYEYTFYSNSYSWFKTFLYYIFVIILIIIMIYFMVLVIKDLFFYLYKKYIEKIRNNFGDSTFNIFSLFFFSLSIIVIFILRLYKFNIKTSTLNSIFLIVVIYFVIYSILSIKKIKEIKFIVKNEHKKSIDYGVLFITLLLLTFFAATRILSQAFPSELPFTNKSCEYGGLISCYDLRGYYNYVEGNEIKCKTIFDITKGSNAYPIIWIQEIGKNGFVINGSKEVRLSNGLIILGTEANTYETPIKINKSQYIYSVRYKTEDDVTIEDCPLYDNTNVYTKEEYFNKEKEKAQWFLGVIMFSFFTILSGVANLKEILKKNEKEKGKK